MSDQDDKNEMVGFKDFLDDQEIKTNRKVSRLEVQSHELNTFLNRENKRLDNLIKIFEEKSHSIAYYPQKDFLYNELNSKLETKKAQLGNMLMSNENSFHRNLSEFLKTHFNL